MNLFGPSPGRGLFDDVDDASDDLFGTKPKSLFTDNILKKSEETYSKDTKILEKKPERKGLFDDEDDDLFVKPSKSVDRESAFCDDDSSSLFASTSKSDSGKIVTGKPAETKSSEVKKGPLVADQSKPLNVNIFDDKESKGLFSGEDSKRPEIRTVETDAPKSLFSEDDESSDIFSVKPAKLVVKKELTGKAQDFKKVEESKDAESKPIKPETAKDLFEDEESDDIFNTKTGDAKIDKRSLKSGVEEHKETANSEVLVKEEKSLNSEVSKDIFEEKKSDDTFGAKIINAEDKKDNSSKAVENLKADILKVKEKEVNRTKTKDQSEHRKSIDFLSSAASEPKVKAAEDIFQAEEQSDLFGAIEKASSKNISKSTKGLFDEDDEEPDLFANKAPKLAISKKPTEKLESSNIPFESASKTSIKKVLSTNIFGDSDEDDDDLFGSSKNRSTLFDQGKGAGATKVMEEKKKETDKNITDEIVESISAADKMKDIKKTENAPKSPKVEKKPIFDDDDEDDDDLFNDKKKKAVDNKENDLTGKSIVNEETKTRKQPSYKPEIIPKNAAILADLKQKLEKHRKESGIDRPVKATQPAKADVKLPKADVSSKIEKLSKADPANVVDGAVSSKRDPPKSLKLKASTINNAEDTVSAETSSTTTQSQVPKKPVVSGKIKNLMGKMGDLKILSPTDVPPILKKNKEDTNGVKSEKDNEESNEDAQNSGASSPSLPSGGSSPQTSGEFLLLFL